MSKKDFSFAYPFLYSVSSSLSATRFFLSLLCLHLFHRLYLWDVSHFFFFFNGSKSKQVTYHWKAALHFSSYHTQHNLRCSVPNLWVGCWAPEAGGDLGPSFSPIPFWALRIRRSLFCFSGGRREKKRRMEDGRICKLDNYQRRRRGVSHRLSVKERSPSPTHTQDFEWDSFFWQTVACAHARPAQPHKTHTY